jgi:CubicO group peptidase (beta-lactamase class C family)
MAEEIFEPLEMPSAGFRAPASGRRRIDQPWGHNSGKPIPPKPYGDNPDAIGPASTVHCSIEDWAKFAIFHLEAGPVGILKKKESFAALHGRPSEKARYGLGWVFDGQALTHDGSNTMWYAVVKLVPKDKTGVLVCVNAGGDDASQLCHEMLRWLDE